MTKRRKDSYFGLHFDFHAGSAMKNVGATLDEEALGRLLDEVKPDYVQCDTKGHPGLTSYRTKYGTSCDLAVDVLRTWRKVTKARGIPLYSHYSGVYEMQAILEHPDWAAVGADGVPSDKMTSVFGPYVDERLLPQLFELAGDIGMDGVWVDGDCWACIIDYSHWATDAWRSKTGTDAPNPPTLAYAEFCRQGFRDYLRHYVDTVHAKYPDFQITSNWMYSSHIPDKPEIALDYLSGDFAPNDSLRSARYEGRYFRHQGMSWDLMAWGFSQIIDGTPRANILKTAVQLEQEASEVLMLGGGFQCYNIQHDGGFDARIIPSMKELAAFVRAREDVCRGAEGVPQVGVVLSNASFYDCTQRPFSPPTAYSADLRGLVQILTDAGHSVDFLPTHYALETDLSAYPVLVMPELSRIEDELREKLLAYVRGGGCLLLTGAHTAEVFGYPSGEVKRRQVTFETGERPAALWTDAACDTAEVTRESVGRGALVRLPVSLGAYMNQRSDAVRDFMDTLLRSLYTPLVTVQGSRNVELAVNRKDGRLLIHLLNVSGPHADANVKQFSEIPPIMSLTVSVRSAQRPSEVTLEPGTLSTPWSWDAGVLTVEVGKLPIHTVIAIR